MSDNLFNLTKELRELDSEIDHETGEIPADISDRMDAITGELEVKGLNIAKWVLSLKSDATAIETEIDRLTRRKQSIFNTQNNVKKYLLTNMQAAGITKISSPEITVRLQNNPPSCGEVNAEETPKEFYTEAVVRTYDKKAILTALKLGQQVSGWVLNENLQHIRIA